MHLNGRKCKEKSSPWSHMLRTGGKLQIRSRNRSDEHPLPGAGSAPDGTRKAYLRNLGTPCSSRSSIAMALVSITPPVAECVNCTISPRAMASALR